MKINVLDKGFVEYVDHLGSDARIVEAARVSYNGHSKGEIEDKKLLGYLFKNRHTSPFEQCSITFKIKLPIFVMRQLIRHRTARVNEVSARYTELTEEFYFPDNWRKQDNKNKQGSLDNGIFNPIIEDSNGSDCSSLFKSACSDSFSVYQKLLKAGVAREMARMILPVNIYTQCYWNIDLNNLFHFLSLRKDSHAQLEIQLYANAMEKIAENFFPSSLDFFKKHRFVLKTID